MSSKLIRPMRALPLLVALLACLSLPAVAGATSYSIKWNRPALLENPSQGGALDSIACAPTNPTKTLLCVAGGPKGVVWATNHPARPAAGWVRQLIDKGNTITGVSCPSTTLCVAIDSSGQVMHSIKPVGGAKYWSKPARIDTATQAGGGYAGLSAISCPTTTLCIAVDNSPNGQVAYTTDPTGPASDWVLATVGTGVSLDSVACASATFCVIGGSARYMSVDPTGGASAWKPTASLSGSAAVTAALTCNTMKLCVGVGYGNAGAGLVNASATPSGAASTWVASVIGSDPPAVGAGLIDGVACPQRNFCIAVDGASNVYTTSAPVRGKWSAGKPLKKASQATQSQIACNTTVCVEVDNRGTVTYGLVKPATTSTTTTTTTTKTTTSPTTTKTGTSTTKTTP